MIWLTCQVPIGLTIAEAAVALCERAQASGRTETARFNWVVLSADADSRPHDLVRDYWRTVARDLGHVAPEQRPVLAPPRGRTSNVEIWSGQLRRNPWRTGCAA